MCVPQYVAACDAACVAMCAAVHVAVGVAVRVAVRVAVGVAVRVAVRVSMRGRGHHTGFRICSFFFSNSAADILTRFSTSSLI